MNTILSLELDGFAITYKQMDNCNMARCHVHNNYELYYEIEGKRYFFADKKCFTLRAGDIFIVPPGVEHRAFDAVGNGYTAIVCNIPKMQMIANATADEGVHFVRPDEELSQLLKKQREKIHELLLKDDSSCDLNIVIEVMNMLSATLASKNCRDEAETESPALDRIADILKYLEEHLSEKISLSSLSEQFFISEFYLSRLFKQCTGKGLWDYISEMRIEKAKNMLLTTNEHVNIIGKKCGFGSVSAFGSSFRKVVGVSPKEYRKNESSLLE